MAKIETEDDKQQECSLQGKEHLPTHGVWLQPSGRTREGMTVEGRSGAVDGHKCAPSRTKNNQAGRHDSQNEVITRKRRKTKQIETTTIQGLTAVVELRHDIETRHRQQESRSARQAPLIP